MNIRPRIRNRPGYALIEMIAVMSISAMILAVLFTVLTSVVRHVTQTDLAVARLQATAQAAESLRREMQEAVTFEIADDGKSLTTKSAAGVSGSKCTIGEYPLRLEWRDPENVKPRVQGLTGFEQGRFERFEIEGGRLPMVALILEPDQRQARRLGKSGPSKPLRLEFAVGSGRRSESAKNAVSEKDAK